LSIHQVGLIAGCSGLGGLIGGALATRLGRSVNRRLILAGGLVILSATTFVLVYWVNSVAFIISVFLFIACLYTLFPYLFGLAADLDPKGGLPAAMGAVYVLTGSTGAFLGGHAVHEFGLESMAWLVAVGAVICYPLLLIVLRQREKQLTPLNAELATH
jgi:predicted MFS family arabinose efflux permease